MAGFSGMAPSMPQNCPQGHLRLVRPPLDSSRFSTCWVRVLHWVSTEFCPHEAGTGHWKDTSGHFLHYTCLSTSRKMVNGYLNITVRTLQFLHLLCWRKWLNGQKYAHCFTFTLQMLAQEHLISNPEIHVETKLEGGPGEVTFSSPMYRERQAL